MASPKTFLLKLIVALRSRRGRDVMMFLLFTLISLVLWGVLSLNDERQYDIRMPFQITHIPDSVTMINPGPEALGVSLQARGTQLFKMTMGHPPTVNADFRAFRSGPALVLNSTDLKGLVRNTLGGTTVNVVYPDSLRLAFTSHPGYKVPVQVNYKVTPGPQAALVGSPRLSTDSVRIYMTGALPDNFTAATTEPIRILGLGETETRRVRVLGPPDSRVIPDSIDVTFEVEAMIFKSRKVVIEPINVPEGTKLITFPAQTDVFYMVPVSRYTNGNSRIRVVADYNTITPNSRNVKLSLRNVPDDFQNVHLKADSAEYIIEKR